MPIFVWNFGLVVSTSALAGLGGLAASAIVLDVSEITQFIDHNKSSYFTVNQMEIKRSPKITQIFW